MELGDFLGAVLVIGFFMWVSYRIGYGNGVFDTVLEETHAILDRIEEKVRKDA